MSSPRPRAGFNVPRPYTFRDGDVTFNFGLSSPKADEISILVVLTKREFLQNVKHYTSDFLILSNELINEPNAFQSSHRWLTENFRQYLLKFIKLKVFL